MGKYKCRGLRANWDSDIMENALRLLREGHSQRSVEQQTGIPRRTLRNHLKSGVVKRSLGRKPILTENQELELEERIIRLAQIGLPLTPKALRRSVYKFVEANRIDLLQQKRNKNIIGKDWYSSFLKRHPRISKRKAQSMNPARSAKLNRPVVTHYFEVLDTTLKKFHLKYSPSRIYNMDEKGCRLTLHHQQSVLALKGSKRVHLVSQEHGENVTIVACVNALGNCIPPMILFKGSRKKPTYSDNMPTGTEVLMSPKGSMTTKLFCEWLDHFGKYKPAGKVLLIFDGAKCHLDISIASKAEEIDVELLCLPSNTTHELQPLDKAVFRSFEHYWDDQLLTYWDQHPDRRLNKDRFSDVFTPVWEKSMTVANITSGFRATGIFPFNPNAIADEAFAPSTLSRKPAEQDSSDDEYLSLSELRLKLNSKKSNTNENIEQVPGPLDTQKDLVTMHSSFVTLVPHQKPDSTVSGPPGTQEYLPTTQSYSALVPPREPESSIPEPSVTQKQPTTIHSCSKTSVPPRYLDSAVPGPSKLQKNSATLSCSSLPQFNKSSDKLPNCEKKTFKEVLKTPELPSRKSQVRRKAFNYKTQLVTKDLFQTEKRTSQNSCQKEKSKLKIDPWFCYLCQSSEKLDMRSCVLCQVWVHEECAGMVPDDTDYFICTNCSE